ncbi:MAG TPA: DUF2752 domain-containing protein [Candidatus Dormibacteraeota bacterium]|nr:DUF2752 domain-containing protein [Candidatus Dormibacteraeota bacterium]
MASGRHGVGVIEIGVGASGPQVAMFPAGPGVRRRNLLVLAGLGAWLAYTRFFWDLQALHATLPRCPFLLLTGHPCPLCGGTRSFAYLWRGDLGRSLALYPLGPFLFVATVATVLALTLAVLTNRDLRVRVPERWVRPALLVAGAVMAVSWGLKLTVLPN